MEKQGEPIGRMTVRNVTYDVRIDHSEPVSYRPQGSAMFTMIVSGKEIRADDWEALYKLAMTASKEAAVKVNIPLLKLTQRRHSWDDPTQFVECTLTGKHQKNGNFLIRRQYGNGKPVTEQTERWGGPSRGFYRPMSKEAQAEGLRLMDAERKAQAAFDAWQQAHAADLDKLYDAAEAEAMEKLDREEGR